MANDPSVQTQLEFQLLGGAVLIRNGRRQTAITSRKGIALLIYLAVKGRSCTREEVADLLWDTTSTAQSLSNLRTVLTRLRPFVGDDLLLVDDTLAFAPSTVVQVDALQLETALRSLLQELTPATAATLRTRLESYQGEFLAGFHVAGATRFSEWAELQRQRFHQSAQRGHHRLVAYCASTGDTDAGNAVAERWLAIDPLDEDMHAHRIRLLMAAGQHQAALAHFDQVRELLARELDARPGQELQLLYAQLLGANPSPLLADAAQAELPHNIPSALTPLIGRASELRRLQQLLTQDDHRLVTLTGEGGIGKTRLALTAARRLVDVDEAHQPTSARLATRPSVQDVAQRFPHGVWFVPLIGVEGTGAILAERLATAVADAVGCTLTGMAPPTTQLVDHLRRRRLLLVLDNFEHILEGADFVVDLLRRAPTVRVLVTSRLALRCLGEQVFPVGGLAYAAPGDAPPAESTDARALTPSGRLFVQRAQAMYPALALTGTEADVVELCALLGGHPLAIELAAVLVGQFTPAELAQLLRQGEWQMLAASTRAVEARHRSLETVFAASWELLPLQAQQTLAALSVFTGRFSRTAAVAVTGAAVESLATLVAHSLLHQAGPGLFEMHALVRHYAHAQLAAQRAVDDICARHSRYYLHEAKSWIKSSPQPGVGASQGAHQDDLSNLRNAWTWAYTHGRIAWLHSALPDLLDFFSSRERFQEGLALFKPAAAALAASDDAAPQLQHALLIACARLHIKQSDLEAAEEILEDLLQTLAVSPFPHAGDAPDAHRLECYMLRGFIRVRQARFRQAREQLLPVIHAPLVATDAVLRGDAFHMLSNLEYQLGNWQAAQRAEEAAIMAHEEAQDALKLAIGQGHLGNIRWAQNHFTPALDHYERALDLCRQSESRGNEGLICYYLARALVYLGDSAQAAAYVARDLAIHETIHDPRGRCYALVGAAYVAHAQQEYDSAATYAHQAVALAQALRELILLAEATEALAHVLTAHGQWISGQEMWRRAYEMRTVHEQPHRAARCLAGLAEVYLAVDDLEAAMPLVDTLLADRNVWRNSAVSAPLEIFRICGQILTAANDPRAREVRRDGHDVLMQQVRALNDDVLRRAFLTRVPTNVALRRAYAGADDATVPAVSVAAINDRTERPDSPPK